MAYYGCNYCVVVLRFVVDTSLVEFIGLNPCVTKKNKNKYIILYYIYICLCIYVYVYISIYIFHDTVLL